MFRLVVLGIIKYLELFCVLYNSFKFHAFIKVSFLFVERILCNLIIYFISDSEL